MKANVLLKANIDALLRARGQTQRDLAKWCRRTDAWLSKILKTDERGLPLKYLDRIADFFGISTYQLLQPGITPLLERRKRARRSGVERRVSLAQAALRDPALDTQELVRMVLAQDDDARRWLYATLLETRLSGTALPKTTAAGPALDVSQAGSHTAEPNRARRRKIQG